jgi:hypothetical protein
MALAADIDAAMRTARKYPFGGQIIDIDEAVIKHSTRLPLLAEDWLPTWYVVANTMKRVLK